MSTSSEKPETGFPVYHPPIETEDKMLFRISPLAIIDHVQDEPERELEKTYTEDSVELKVRGGLKYDEEDPTQKKWGLEYGAEFFTDGPKNGLVRQFVKYEPVHSTKRSSQSTISERVFTKLENRSLRNYAKKGFEEAAEILRGKKV